MKRLYIILFLLLSVMHSYSQILIDNGPLIDPNVPQPYYTLSGAKWNKISLKYYINNVSKHLTANQRQSIIQQAFKAWGAVSVLTFTQVTNESSADFKIKWATGAHGDTESFDGPGDVLAMLITLLRLGGVM